MMNPIITQATTVVITSRLRIDHEARTVEGSVICWQRGRGVVHNGVYVIPKLYTVCILSLSFKEGNGSYTGVSVLQYVYY